MYICICIPRPISTFLVVYLYIPSISIIADDVFNHPSLTVTQLQHLQFRLQFTLLSWVHNFALLTNTSPYIIDKTTPPQHQTGSVCQSCKKLDNVISSFHHWWRKLTEIILSQTHQSSFASLAQYQIELPYKKKMAFHIKSLQSENKYSAGCQHY